MGVAHGRGHSYAKAYSFGTDGSAALAGTPISSVRRFNGRSRRAPRPKGIRLPLWVVVLVVGGAVFFQAFVLLGLRSDAAQEQKQVNLAKLELTRVQEVTQSLEVRLAEADDPARIQAVAVNRLGLRPPTADQIIELRRPQRAVETKAPAAPREGGGLFKLLLSLIGR